MKTHPQTGVINTVIQAALFHRTEKRLIYTLQWQAAPPIKQRPVRMLCTQGTQNLHDCCRHIHMTRPCFCIQHSNEPSIKMNVMSRYIENFRPTHTCMQANKRDIINRQAALLQSSQQGIRLCMRQPAQAGIVKLGQGKAPHGVFPRIQAPLCRTIEQQAYKLQHKTNCLCAFPLFLHTRPQRFQVCLADVRQATLAQRLCNMRPRIMPALTAFLGNAGEMLILIALPNVSKCGHASRAQQCLHIPLHYLVGNTIIKISFLSIQLTTSKNTYINI